MEMPWSTNQVFTVAKLSSVISYLRCSKLSA
jgi:hypothetical protein